MNQVEVQIMGQSYILGCPEGAEERFQTAVRKVDAAMCSIRDVGKIKARDRIAVLAALNLAFELSDFSAVPTEPVSSTHNLNNLLHRLDSALGQDGHLL
jgi:cell division protein ZapA